MKKWLASLLTVVMIVALVPVSVVPSLAAGGTVHEITSGTDHPLYGKLTPGSNYPEGNVPAVAGDTVKLMTNVTIGDAASNVKGDGVTLDLNGHKITSTKQPGLAVVATGAGARVVDKAPGKYTLYKNITTTGKQWIAMGLTNYEITGVDAATSFNRAGTTDNKRSAFLGGYWSSYQWELLSVQANNGAQMNNRFCYGTTGVDDSSMNPTFTVGTQFTASVRLMDNLQQLIFNGTTKRNTTTAVVCPAPAMPEKNILLLTHSTPLSTTGSEYAGLLTALSTDSTKGCWGWDGTTEYAKIYGDLTKNGSEANLLRDFVPAKAPDGKIGMFDKVEGVFYPLLGDTQYASVGGGDTGYAIVKADGSAEVHPVIEVNSPGAHPLYGIIGTGDYIPPSAPINRVAAPGEIIRLTSDTNHSDAVWNFAVTGVTLDLNGHKIAAKNVPNAVDVNGLGSRVVDMKAGTYTLYDSITTTGKQYLATGLDARKITGMKTRTSSNRSIGSPSWSFMLGGYAGGTYQFMPMTMSKDLHGLMVRFCYEGCTVDDANIAWKTAGVNVGDAFTYEYINNNGIQKIWINDTERANKSGEGHTYPAAAMPGLAVDLFNRSGVAWASRVETASFELNPDAGKNTDPKFGQIGWDGVTNYVRLYSDAANATANTNLVRDYVPAARADGLIGMFDKVEGLFYPLLGATDYASLGNAIGTAVVAADGDVSYRYSADTYAELAGVVASLESGEVELTGDIKLEGDIEADHLSFAFDNDVELDLNGHKFTYGALEFDGSVGVRVVDSSVKSYQKFDHLFTDGKQFITTGLNMSEISGLYAETSVDRENPSGNNPTFFGAYVYKDSVIYRFQPMQMDASNSKVRFGRYNDTPVEINLADNLGEKFTYNFYLDGNGQGHNYFGGVIDSSNDTIESASIYNRDLGVDCQVNLLNVGGGRNATKNFDYASMTDGYRGWYGKTYAAKIYTATDGSANTPENLARDYIPVEADGVIGMYDQANELFYPLLGVLDGAKLEKSPIAEKIGKHEPVTLTDDTDLTGEGPFDVAAGQVIDLGEHTLTVDDITIDANADIQGEGQLITKNLVVSGELNNWMPVKVVGTTNTYEFVYFENANAFEETPQYWTNEADEYEGAAVFELTDAMQEAVYELLADEDYQFVITAVVKYNHDVNFYDGNKGEFLESGKDEGEFTFKFDLTGMLKDNISATFENFYVQFEGVTDVVDKITCTMEIINEVMGYDLTLFDREIQKVAD